MWTLAAISTFFIFSMLLLSDFHHSRIRAYFHHHLFNTAHKHTHCVMYDKTPRTGSSTILNALRKCWKSHGYSFAIPRRRYSNDSMSLVDDCLAIDRPRIAIGGSHFTMRTADIRAIAHQCKHLFYVTSTREMKNRLMSKAKYRVSGARTYKNTTVEERQWGKVMKIIQKEKDAVELKLEKYPFKTWKLGIIPDYVINSNSLMSDISQLLDAFQCEIPIYTTNVHAYLGNETKENEEELVVQGNFTQSVDKNGLNKTTLEEQYILDQLHLNYGDRRHKNMLRYARKHNLKGLSKAWLFVNPNRSTRNSVT